MGAELRISHSSLIEMRQHLFPHEIEARRVIPRRAQPQVFQSQACQTPNSLDNIRRRARDRKAIEKVFGQPQLINELSVFSGLYPMLRVVVFLNKATDVVLKIIRNLLSGKPGSQRMVSRRRDTRPHIPQGFFSLFSDAQSGSPPDFQICWIPFCRFCAFMKVL